MNKLIDHPPAAAGVKQCSRCRKELPLDQFTAANGTRSTCDGCRRSARSYAAASIERASDHEKAAIRESARERDRRRRAALAERRRLWRDAHPALAAAIDTALREARREKFAHRRKPGTAERRAERRRRWAAEHRAERLAYFRRRRELLRSKKS